MRVWRRAFYIPNPTIGLSLFSVGLTLLFVTAVVRQKASQYQSLQAGLHASVTDYFEYDSTPAVTTDGRGQIQYRNQAAISRFRDGGETLLSALDQTISAPAATLRRLKDRAERSGFAREEVVARSGHIRLSAHRIGHDNILWRIEEIAERGQASRSAASLALPMMTISKAGTVLFMNETLKRLLGGRAAHLDRVVNDLPIRADQVHEVAGAGGPIKARIHVIQGGIARNVDLQLQSPMSPYQVMAGTIISASLITGLNSDLPGRVIAQVTQPVYDTVTGQYMLIPQGSRLLGKYDSVVAFGQERALVVWQRLILPDGSSIIIDNLPATDRAGYAGLEDQVDFHTWRLIKGIALSTLFSVGAELAFDDDSDLVRAIQRGSQNSINRAGQRIVEREINIQPTITIRPGYPLRVIVHMDIILRPFIQRKTTP